ncbi:Cinnamoyl-CoA reductase 1 [Morella rubra]|uniref:Cinnamoyl-CoA reductase 1 n=1 Tax=Morella rubra TaxID=262757 RepID=A0A6A1UX18_9ROSI|nr:Cinnamoyl-CoA reductase 1 [Morella rubra]
MSGEAERTVCVTGASGYIASWLVKHLLQRGYTVKASVRDPNNPKKTEHLLALDGAKERLHLFKADLLEEGSFDSLVNGCEGVFHTASPVAFNVTDPQAGVVDPAVKGTLNILRSCVKASSVKRVVITSSMAAVFFSGKPLTADVVLDETCFSDPAFCEKSEVHIYANFLLHTISCSGAQKNLDPIVPIWVDVRDTVNAHILAFENPSASGRHCLVASTISCSEVVKILRELFPHFNIPENGDEPFVSSCCKVSKEKAESLVLNYTPVEVSLKDTVESLRAKNFLSV